MAQRTVRMGALSVPGSSGCHEEPRQPVSNEAGIPRCERHKDAARPLAKATPLRASSRDGTRCSADT